MSAPSSGEPGPRIPGRPPGASRFHLAAVVCLGLVTTVIDLSELLWNGYTTGWLLAILITAVALGATVALRRSRPATALAVAGLVYAVASAILFTDTHPLPATAQAALWVAVFSAIATGTDRLRLTAIVTLGTCVALDVYQGVRMSDADAFEPALLVYCTVSLGFIPVVVVAAAEAVRGRVQLATARAEQAEHLRQLDARAAVRDERLRLARELHDVVANRLSAVTMRITAEGHVRPHGRTTPESEALAEIGLEIGTALSELRSVLGTLRDDDGATGTAAPPSLRDVDLLAEEARRAGAEVEIVISGDPFPLPSMVDLASYRIVQEALTNVARHAFPPCATVRLEFGGDRLGVRVDDEGVLGAGPHMASSGHGIIGIRERAAQCGGWAAAGPRPEGGWTVEAALPLNKDVP